MQPDGLDPGTWIGKQIGNYRLTKVVGRGGMGLVFEAVHEGVMGRAAIKILRPDVTSRPDTTARFFNEARAANAISHPGIVRVFDCGLMEDGLAYLTMEFLDGESLRSRLTKYHSLPIKAALRIARQAASALAAAHRADIIHRDIKPDNIMLVRDPDFPGGERVKLLDFGIAKMAEHLSAQPVRTKSDVLMGTPTYMAPEQCRGAKLATDRSDVYSLGVILYQMLAGQPPFLGASMGDLIAMHLMDAPRPLTELVDGLSPKIWRLVRALLAKKPSDRPPMEKVHKTLLALEEETKADPSEIELSDKEVTPPQDSQHATVDVPAPRATTSGSTSATSSKRPVQSAQLRAQLALPSAMVSDTRHIHIPRRTVHLLIGALATSAVIVTTGILLGTQAPGRPRPASQRVVGSSTSDSAETTTEPSADPATSGARTDAGTSAAPSGATAKTLPGSPDRRDATTKRTDAAHGTIGKPRGASTDETETAAPVAAAANPAVPTPAAAATAMPDLAKPAPIAPPSPNPTATENAAKPEAVVASKPSDDDDDEPAQPAAKPGAAAPAFAKATPASQASASDDPFDPLKTAEAFIAQGSYRRAMDLATQFGKQDPMRAWEIFGRAACGLRSLDRANRALRELRQHQETRRIQSLTDYCRLHKIIVPESGAQ